MTPDNVIPLGLALPKCIRVFGPSENTFGHIASPRVNNAFGHSTPEVTPKNHLFYNAQQLLLLLLFNFFYAAFIAFITFATYIYIYIYIFLTHAMVNSFPIFFRVIMDSWFSSRILLHHANTFCP